MNFNESSQYIRNLDVFGSNLGLERINKILEKLGNPEKSLKCIHITGTNGKGSTLAFISKVLSVSGYKVGTYSSPAVINEYDQYRINTDVISEEDYAKAVTKIKPFIEELAKEKLFVTRFEAETVMAFLIFQDKNTDICVIETGLGGEYDATNVITNVCLHVFASISEDHKAELGNTISEIAENKAGIIKNSAPVVFYNSSEDALKVIERRCKKYNNRFVTVNNDDITDREVFDGYQGFSYKGNYLKTKMCSEYQFINAALAYEALTELKKEFPKITEDTIREGLLKAYWPFRFEIYSKKPLIIFDGAHNPDGAEFLKNTVEKMYGDKEILLVTGIFKDKDYKKICEITGGFPKKIFVTENELSKRKLDSNELYNEYIKYNANVSICSKVEDAVSEAYSFQMKDVENRVILLSGSLSWLNRAKDFIDKSLLNRN